MTQKETFKIIIKKRKIIESITKLVKIFLIFAIFVVIC